LTFSERGMPIMRSNAYHCCLRALAFTLVFGGSAWAADDIKVGMLYPLTGIYAAPGRDSVEGATLAFEEAGSQIGGHKVVLIAEDDEAAPNVALAKAKKLVERDRVQVLMGVIWSPNAMALRGYVHEQKVPFVTDTAVRPITQEAGSPYIFRTVFSSGQLTHPFGTYACGKLGYRKVVVIAFDSVFGREEADYFETGCKLSGGAVPEKIYAPVETADFAPYFARIQQANPDAVLGIWAGAAALRFLKQYSDFGLKQKYPLLAFGSVTDESFLPTAGASAQGVVSYFHYSPAIDSAENKRFLEAYRKRFGREVSWAASNAYITGRAIVEAAKVVNGDLSDTGRFLTALKAVRFDSPAGRFRFDAHQSGVKNMYVRKVQPGPGGRLENAVIDVVNDVEQYWPKGKPAK
jgi:branched-chain amino acid transport system substrate-binding protein